MVEALVGCIAGAVLIDETRRMAREAGLSDVQIEVKADYARAMADWSDPLYRKIAEKLPSGTSPADYVASVNVTARKPE